MALTPFDPLDDLMLEPFAGLMSLRQAMNRLFEESFIGPKFLEPLRQLVPVDLRETQSEYVIEASLPGIKPQEIQITATENVLTIRATHTEEQKTEKDGEYYRRRERYEGEMSRSISLPGPVDASKVNAVYEHGMLTIRVPKTAELKPTEIPVQVKGPTKAQKELPKAPASV